MDALADELGLEETEDGYDAADDEGDGDGDVGEDEGDGDGDVGEDDIDEAMHAASDERLESVSNRDSANDEDEGGELYLRYMITKPYICTCIHACMQCIFCVK